MRRSVLVAPRGCTEPVSQDPLDVLEHGERPRHRVVSEPLENAAGSGNDERWHHNEVDPRRALLRLLLERGKLDVPVAAWVRLPRRLSRKRRIAWRGSIWTALIEGQPVPRVDGDGRVVRGPAPRAPVVPQGDVELWLRGRAPEFAGRPPGGPGAVQHVYREGARGRARRDRSRAQIASAVAAYQARGTTLWSGALEWERYYPAEGLGLPKAQRPRRRRYPDYDPVQVRVTAGGIPLTGYDLDRPPLVARDVVTHAVFTIRIPVVGQHGPMEPLITRIGARSRERAIELANLGYRDCAERPDGQIVALDMRSTSTTLEYVHERERESFRVPVHGLSIIGNRLALMPGGSHPCAVEWREPYRSVERFMYGESLHVHRRDEPGELRVQVTLPAWDRDLPRLVELAHHSGGPMVTIVLHLDTGPGSVQRMGSVVQVRQHHESTGSVRVDLVIMLYDTGRV